MKAQGNTKHLQQLGTMIIMETDSRNVFGQFFSTNIFLNAILKRKNFLEIYG